MCGGMTTFTKEPFTVYATGTGAITIATNATITVTVKAVWSLASSGESVTAQQFDSVRIN